MATMVWITTSISLWAILMETNDVSLWFTWLFSAIIWIILILTLFHKVRKSDELEKCVLCLWEELYKKNEKVKAQAKEINALRTNLRYYTNKK